MADVSELEHLVEDARREEHLAEVLSVGVAADDARVERDQVEVDEADLGDGDLDALDVDLVVAALVFELLQELLELAAVDVSHC